MKRFIKLSFVLLAMLGVLFTSCKKEYENPPIDPFPDVEAVSIGDILSMSPNTTFDGVAVTGIVTADEQSGNLYKQIFIQDAATGKAIELMLNTSSAARIGDKVRVYLDSTIMFNMYHNLPQLVNSTDGKGFNPDKHLYIYPHNDTVAPIEPKVVTIADIKAGQYTAALVKLENVEFADPGKPFCDLGSTTNRTLKDATGEVIVRSSNYSNFAYDLIPAGSGSLVAIASVYNNDWQLILRSVHNKDDFNFEGGNPPAPAGELQSIPYTQSFTSGFGTYMTYDALGDQSWEIDYSTAKMTGYVGGSYYANEDWLISSPVDLRNVNSAKMTMKYIGRYFNSISTDVSVMASTDYTYGDDPRNANWYYLPAGLVEGSNWNDFLTAEFSLENLYGESLAGQIITVAIKYTSTDDKAGTMEIQSIAIDEGSGIIPPTPGPGGDVQNMPYSQSFASDFGTYTTYDALGPESWMIDFSTAKMTGYVSQTESHANEDWLISSPVAITGVDDAKMTMVYIGRYFDNINADVTIWASTNYTWNSDPTTASWTQVPATLSESNNWQNFVTTEIALTDYVGQTVTIAVKYVSRNSRAFYAGTIEIQSITIEEGTGVTPTPPPTPGNPEGSGTADDPYNVAAGIGVQNEQPTAWVHGYIVGAVKNGDSHNTVTSNDDIDWEAPFGRATNVLIADDQNCREVSNCIIVKLPSGKPLRTEVNLMDHPENLGKDLAVLGVLKKVFGQQAGLSDSNGTENDFVLEGGTPTPPPTPPTPGTGIFSESFANGQGDFTIQDVNLSGLNYVWNYMNNFKCMKANGYLQGAHAAESWLVSPQIDMTEVTTATLSFDHALNFAQGQGVLSVQVSTNYTGNVTTATWTELTIDVWPEQSNNFPFVTATINMNAFAGQTVTIAFRYNSTTSQCPAWEVKNIVIE